MSVKKIKAAIIGCGTISEIYMTNLTEMFHIVELVGCSDLIPERSARRAEQFGLRQMTNKEILSDPEIEIVVNLTFPQAHYEVTKAALLAGKHVYVEKMVAVTWEEGQELMLLAAEQKRVYTAAPDTFLGAIWQTARKAVDDGLIGELISIAMVKNSSYQLDGEMNNIGPDNFYFTLHPGGGLPFDFGGYYLHNMINLAGPISRVSGFCKTVQPNRLYTNPRHPMYGEPFFVDTITSLAGVMEFENGVYGTMLITSDSSMSDVFMISGTEGTLMLPDPNFFDGSLILSRQGTDTKELPVLHGYRENSRGIGVADMAYAIRNQRRPRAHAALGLHAFEVIHGIKKSCESNSTYKMTSTCERPAILRTGSFGKTGQEIVLDH